jgi:hypothetical protein
MLPKNLKYQTRIESAPSKSYRSNLAPQNGTGDYKFGDTIIFNIPTRNNLVLVPTESYLKFDVQFTNPTAANYLRWDSCGSHGLIQRLRIFHGSNLLQDIDNYGMLAKLFFDLQVSTDASYGKYNILAGTRNDLNTQLPAIAEANAPAAAAAYAQGDTTTTITLVNAIKAAINGANRQSLQINSGEIIGENVGAGATTTKLTYCLNLFSLLGTLSTQYFPLFACTSGPLRLELQIVSSATQCVGTITDLTPLVINNCEYVANMIELSDSAMAMIQSSLNGQPLQYVVPDYKNYAYTAPSFAANTLTQIQMSIPAKFSSLKSLLLSFRDRSTGTLTYFPFSSIKAGIVDYTFRVGSVVFPPKAPSTIPEMFAEVLKAIGSMSDLHHQPSIEKFTYTIDRNATAIAAANFSSLNSGSFYVGLDLENYANANKDSIFAGYNSNTDDIYFVGNFRTAAGSGDITLRIDAYAMFDEVVVFENNTAYCRF